MTIGICYGFVEGKTRARRFARLCKKSGFELAELENADLIVAHSAGCWLLPADIHPKLVIYVGMPLNRSRSQENWLKSTIDSINIEGLKNNITARLSNIYYLLRNPIRNLKIIAHPRIGYAVEYADTPTIFIANQHDSWPIAEDFPVFIANHPWTFIGLPGTHDDIWQHPDRYVAIIKHYADGLLAQTGKYQLKG